MIYLMDSFHKNQIEFEDKIFSIEELVNEFCFLRLKKKKCYLPENNKIELKKFLVEMAKTNSSYIQFKETNSKKRKVIFIILLKRKKDRKIWIVKD